ncbi:MAG TPA: hypothetical protein VK862_15340 [Afifellaceae bacterium]|nr:hypothetical protein [Afifellaceae bacterium]
MQYHSVEWIAIRPHGIFTPERHLYRRQSFKLNRVAAHAEWRQLYAA